MPKVARLISFLFLALCQVVLCDSETPPRIPDCLYVVAQEYDFDVSKHRDKCFRDELGFGQNKTVRKTEDLLGIRPTEIKFIGCSIAPFYTRVDRTEPELHFEILYNSEMTQSGSLIAIMHELGHVYQLKQAGSRERLLEALHRDLQRVELGADYLAGLSVARLNMSEKETAVGLALVGSYVVRAGSHGLPHERSAAFNYGHTDGKTNDSLGALYIEFQDNGYGQIKQPW
jgi:hypothetical protein